MLPAWAEQLLAVFGPLGAALGAWLVWRASRRSTEVTGLTGLVNALQADVKALRERLVEAEAKADTADRKADHCADQVESLKRHQRADRRLIDLLVDHVQQWRRWAQQVQAGQDVPPPITPDELAEHLD